MRADILGREKQGFAQNEFVEISIQFVAGHVAKRQHPPFSLFINLNLGIIEHLINPPVLAFQRLPLPVAQQ